MQRWRFVAVIVVVFDGDAVIAVVDFVRVGNMIIVRLKMNKVITDSKRCMW
jgi:hypothetical protein